MESDKYRGKKNFLILAYLLCRRCSPLDNLVNLIKLLIESTTNDLHLFQSFDLWSSCSQETITKINILILYQNIYSMYTSLPGVAMVQSCTNTTTCAITAWGCHGPELYQHYNMFHHCLGCHCPELHQHYSMCTSLPGLSLSKVAQTLQHVHVSVVVQFLGLPWTRVAQTLRHVHITAWGCHGPELHKHYGMCTSLPGLSLSKVAQTLQHVHVSVVVQFYIVANQ